MDTEETEGERAPPTAAGSPPLIPPAIEAADEEDAGGGGARREGEGRGDADEDDDFQFAFVCDDPEAASPADEIFYNGKILPVYPVFGRDLPRRPSWFGKNEDEEAAAAAAARVRKSLRSLLNEDEREMCPSCSSSEADELEGIPEESYCLWTPGSVPPSPDMKKKSMSTGSSTTSSSPKSRLRDLVVGRSQSDGKKKFVFLAPTSSPPPSANGPRNSVELGESKGNSVQSAESSGSRTPRNSTAISAHRRGHHAKGGETGTALGVDRRQSYLPYRKDLIGIFAGMNGTNRGFR